MSDDYSDEENGKIYDFRMEMFKHILKQQFQLAYFGKVDFCSTEGMAKSERELLWSMLVEQKDEERKAQEKAIQEAKSKKSSGSWRRKH